MAIDTLSKRVSTLNYASTRLPPLPSGSVGTSDRYTLLGSYIGIGAALPQLLLRLAFDNELISNLEAAFKLQKVS